MRYNSLMDGRLIKFRSFFFYYRRFFGPALLLSFFLSGISGTIDLQRIGVLFFFLSAFFQLVLYEFFYKNDYIFYFHLGWGKTPLWLYSIFLNAMITLIMMLL